MSVGTTNPPAQQEQVQTATPATVPVQPERVPLADVLRQVQQDAANDPSAYLDETVVPHGGE